MTSRRLALAQAVALAAGMASAQPGAAPRQYGAGHPFEWDELPPGILRSALNGLGPADRARAMKWLHGFSFPREDAVRSLRADAKGGIYYVCEFPLPDKGDSDSVGTFSDPPAAGAPIPISPFPDSLKFSSRPGATNILFLDFDGHVVTGTAWNSSLGRDPIPALPFSIDSDYTTYSDAEQLAIKRIWQRVAEDFAPFDVNVTTVEPTVFNTRTARALITRNTDANGDPNPSSTAGGVAYVNVFGSSTIGYYSPAWIYHNNLSQRDDYIAEATSHELGHNLGLSHDGKTDGTEYYNGHGSGDTSWGPIMGTGYGRNVSQWSKGEYYLANNTQDDLLIIANKLRYRADDHGNTPASASFLTISSGSNVVATTPETDPANTNSANKGIIGEAGDVDVWLFAAGSGPLSLAVRSWRSPTNTHGGNLDVLVRLLDTNGNAVAAADPTNATFAVVSTTVPEGIYALEIIRTATGNPTNSTPTGYTTYGVMGQYFITGRITKAVTSVIPPQAALVSAPSVSVEGGTTYVFAVRYSDNAAISVASLGDDDVEVIGPGGYAATGRLVSVDSSSDGTPRTATYAIVPPGGAWNAADNGEYEIRVRSNTVADIEGAYVAAGPLGSFMCAIAQTLYFANMDTDPGWTLTSPWAWGIPAGIAGDPTSGATGMRVVGYNLTGTYARGASLAYATTPVIPLTGEGAPLLRFKRWLGIQSGDTAKIEASTNGGPWITIWSAPGNVVDTAWQSVQFDLAAYFTNPSSIRVRWGLSANNDNRVSFGWNIDDVELIGLGGVPADTAPPVPLLLAPNVSEAGATTYLFTVTYTDDTAVAVASFDSEDVLIVGPNGFSNLASFVEADDPTDGTPRSATYAIVPPGGAWDAADNGIYQVVLQEGAVLDTSGNATPGSGLGSFAVSIVPPVQWTLLVHVNDPARGRVTPDYGVYNDGAPAVLLAEASNYYFFAAWTGDLSGVDNPLQIIMTNDVVAYARFDELRTTNYHIPLVWLAAQGITSDFETAVSQVGANDFPLWASFIAGLDPSNPTSRLEWASSTEQRADGRIVLRWQPVTGRVYAIYATPDLLGAPPEALAGAEALTWPRSAFTAEVESAESPGFFQLRVRLADEP